MQSKPGKLQVENFYQWIRQRPAAAAGNCVKVSASLNGKEQVGCVTVCQVGVWQRVGRYRQLAISGQRVGRKVDGHFVLDANCATV